MLNMDEADWHTVALIAMTLLTYCACNAWLGAP